VYTNIPQVVLLLVLWWSHLTVRVCDQNDRSLVHMVAIPKKLYDKRLNAFGEMKNLPKKGAPKDRKTNKPLYELLETHIGHFEPLVEIVVDTKGTLVDGVCVMDRFWQADLGAEVIVNTQLRYGYEYPPLKEPLKVVVIPLERFLEGYLFSDKDVYPTFTEHLEDVLYRSLGGWIAMKHLFCLADKKADQKSDPKAANKGTHQKSKKNSYTAYAYPYASTAVGKFLDVDMKKDVQAQLDGIKKLIGFDTAHVPLGDVIDDAVSDGDDDRSNGGASAQGKQPAIGVSTAVDQVQLPECPQGDGDMFNSSGNAPAGTVSVPDVSGGLGNQLQQPRNTESIPAASVPCTRSVNAAAN